MMMGSPKCVSATAGSPPKLETNQKDDDHLTALPYIRTLTRPLLHPPTIDELKEALMQPWTIRIPVDTKDATTYSHWHQQVHTELFHQMFDWNTTSATNNGVPLAPYFSFGNAGDPFFFQPWQDVGHCLQNLLFHQIGASQTLFSTLKLTSHETDVFVATNHTVHEDNLVQELHVSPHYYLLRCHYDQAHHELIFGYHQKLQQLDSELAGPFCPLHRIELDNNDNWRLETCVMLTNMAKIIHALQDYAIPLTCEPDKRRLVQLNDDHQLAMVEKVYQRPQICGIFQATVDNMIAMYQLLEQHDIPYTDRLVSVAKDAAHDNTTICRFAPVGRSYPPETCTELLQALICVTKALVQLHALHMMHRDIRWANVFHALDDNHHHQCFSNDWILFDFEFAAQSPQPAFGHGGADNTLTPDNHAPEMLARDGRMHTTAVDVWGVGYLMRHAHVAVPQSHRGDLLQLQEECLQEDPMARPTAGQCLDRLLALQVRPQSTELEIAEIVREVPAARD